MSPELNDYIERKLTSAISRNKTLKQELISLTSYLPLSSTTSERIFNLNGGEKPECKHGNSYKWNNNLSRYEGCGNLSNCKCALENKNTSLHATLNGMKSFNNLVSYVKTFVPVTVTGNFIETQDVTIYYYDFNNVQNKDFCKNLLGDKRVIVIFEDELKNKKDIVYSRLKYIFNKNKIFIGARKTEIRFINSTKEFLNEIHIQGDCASKYKIGAFYNNELVAVMTFGSKRVFTNSKSSDDCYELIRYASKYNIPGIASKLFKFFIKKINPTEIISYCDLRWGTGNVYEKLGFCRENKTYIGYWYTKNGVRYHRYKFRKSELVKQGYDETKTESEIMKSLGYEKIYDCGVAKYIWK